MLPNVARYQMRHTLCLTIITVKSLFVKRFCPPCFAAGKKDFYQVFFMITVSTQSPACSQASAQASRQS